MFKYLYLFIVLSCIIIPETLFAAFNWDGVFPCQPMFTRLSFVDEDTSTTMGITWQTKDECSAELRYGSGINPENYVTGTTIKANENLGYVHQVTLENLTHTTFYQYQVGGEGNWSFLYNFKTAPFKGSCDPFTFAVASDSRVDQTAESGNPLKWGDIFREALNDGADFLINGGDMVWDGNVASQWLNYLETTGDSFAEKPLMIALGNHDNGPGEGEGANFNQLMHFPKNPVTETEDSHYFRYGNALFINLSTSTYTDKFEELAVWMDEVLTENSDAKWKFVFEHHPFYSSAGLAYLGVRIGHEMNEVGQNPYFIPIFDKHHVDFVVSAHSHYYERFSPSYGYVQQEDPDDIEPQLVNNFDDGTVYVVSGGGGAITFQNFLVDMLCTNSIKGSQSCNGKNHYLKFMINNNHLVMEMWTTTRQFDGSNPDDHELVDIVEIFKADDSCAEIEEPDDDSVDEDAIDTDSETPDETEPTVDEDTAETTDTEEPDTLTDETEPEVDNDPKETVDENDMIDVDSGCSCSLVF